MIKETILLYSEYIALGTILLLSIIGHNMTVAYAAGIVFVIKALGLTSLLQVIGSNGIHWGILILTVAILIPIATGEITLHIMLDSFKTPLGIIAIIAGILAVAAGGFVLALLETSPEVVSARPSVPWPVSSSSRASLWARSLRAASPMLSCNSWLP